MLTNKQQKDLETIVYFIPTQVKLMKITDKDIEKFFEYSDQWKHKEDIDERWVRNWFDALVQGKRWRGIHMQMYEEGILDGSMPYFTLLEWYDTWRTPKWFWRLLSRVGLDFRLKHKPIPRSVVDFMKKEMFKWHDAETIERAYNIVLGTKQK